MALNALHHLFLQPPTAPAQVVQAALLRTQAPVRPQVRAQAHPVQAVALVRPHRVHLPVAAHSLQAA